MKYIGVVVLMAVLVSCGTKKACELDKSSEESMENVVQVKAQEGDVLEGDAIRIESVEIQGDHLRLEVSYGGGCEEHEFNFTISTVSTMSIPPQRQAGLIHHSNNDRCKAMLRKTIDVDLSVLNGEEVVLHLNGWEEQIHVNKK